MELVNQTPVAANVKMSVDERTGLKYGIITAKVTFRINTNGTTEIEKQKPFPIFDTDVETDLGLLPSDIYPRRDPAFEVILLGAAYAQNNNPTPSRTIELAVGDIKRHMLVFGERWWVTREEMSPPKPFLRISLTYDYAFGGSCEAYFDEHTILDVEDPMNKYGRGFDAEKKAKDLAEGLQSPKGFPRMEYHRMLPNIENPDMLISSWEEEPEPYCWVTVPQDIGFRVIEAMRKFRQDGEPPELDEARNMVYHRAHPDWIIALPPPRSSIRLIGMTPDDDILAFDLPALRIISDYVIDKRIGARELVPQLLVLLPEERRFYLVYRSAFTLEVLPEMERSFRLRLDDGWFQY